MSKKGNCALCGAQDVDTKISTWETTGTGIKTPIVSKMVVCKGEHVNPGCPHGRASWTICPWCLGINDTKR